MAESVRSAQFVVNIPYDVQFMGPHDICNAPEDLVKDATPFVFERLEDGSISINNRYVVKQNDRRLYEVFFDFETHQLGIRPAENIPLIRLYGFNGNRPLNRKMRECWEKSVYHNLPADDIAAVESFFNAAANTFPEAYNQVY